MISRRGFFASLAALVVVPAVPVKPAFRIKVDAEHLRFLASIREAEAQLRRCEALSAASHHFLEIDSLPSYLNWVTAEHHEILNARDLARRKTAP